MHARLGIQVCNVYTTYCRFLLELLDVMSTVPNFVQIAAHIDVVVIDVAETKQLVTSTLRSESSVRSSQGTSQWHSFARLIDEMFLQAWTRKHLYFISAKTSIFYEKPPNLVGTTKKWHGTSKSLAFWNHLPTIFRAAKLETEQLETHWRCVIL